MNLRSRVLVFSLILMSQVAFAQTKLVITSTGGTTINTPVENITEITFSPAGMKIVTTGENQIIPISDIVDVTFDTKHDTSGAASADLGDLTARLEGDVLTATAEGKIEMTAFDIKGRQVASAAGETEVSLDLQSLPKGVYIVRVNNKVVKVIR